MVDLCFRLREVPGEQKSAFRMLFTPNNNPSAYLAKVLPFRTMSPELPFGGATSDLPAATAPLLQFQFGMSLQGLLRRGL